ncbi:MAG: tetratricopeptide repeat protein, partial [Thermoplasmata archaeon]|nr:tetratricopeptide repeat protein [Thermoplasmata archaeon]
MPRGVRSFRKLFALLIALEALVLYAFLLFPMLTMDQAARFGAVAVFLVAAVFEGFLFLRGELKLLATETPLLAGIRVRQFLVRSAHVFLLLFVLMLVVAPVFIFVPLSTPTSFERRVSPLVYGRMDFWVMGVPAFRQDVTLDIEARSDFDIYVIERGSDEGFVVPEGVPVTLDRVHAQRVEDLFNLSVHNATEDWRFHMSANGSIDIYIMPDGVNQRYLSGIADPMDLRGWAEFLENCTFYVQDSAEVKVHLTLARGDYRVLMLAAEDVNDVSVVAYRWSGEEPLIFASGRSMSVPGSLFPGQYSVVIFNLRSVESDVSIRASVFYLRPIGELLLLVSLISFIGYGFTYLYARSVSDGLIGRITTLPDEGEVEAIGEQVSESLRRIRKRDFLRYLREEAVKLKEVGNRLFMEDRYSDALVFYDRALAIDPDNVNLWNNKALALRALNRYDDALAAYEKAIRLDPANEKFRAGRDACMAAIDGEDVDVGISVERAPPPGKERGGARKA